MSSTLCIRQCNAKGLDLLWLQEDIDMYCWKKISKSTISTQSWRVEICVCARVCVLGCVAKNLGAETEIGRCLENKTSILNTQTTTQKKLKIGVSSPKYIVFCLFFKFMLDFSKKRNLGLPPK